MGEVDNTTYHPRTLVAKELNSARFKLKAAQERERELGIWLAQAEGRTTKALAEVHGWEAALDRVGGPL